MATSQKYPLSELVHVDEFTHNNKVKQVSIKGIKDSSAKYLTPILEEHISMSVKNSD